MSKLIFTPGEIAEGLKTTRRTVYRWIENGELKSFKAGKLVRVTREDMEEFLGRPIPWDDGEEEEPETGE